jgi:tetratricopeptide (TPR) repeat protein
MAIALGDRLAHYEVLSKLGAGGMGAVYLARDTRLDRKVALKLLSEEFMADESRVQRFEQEAKVASALNHPNIITVYEIGHSGEQYFIAIEYVVGETLRDVIQQGTLSFRDTLDIGKQIASALTAAHEAGIVHRDIKPENVMIRPDGLVKVLDFGLAKQTERRKIGVNTNSTTSEGLITDPGMVMGTPHYMSPEQARGVAVDSRTDIFSLGSVLYEMATRRPPFEGETSSDLIAEVLKTEPPPVTEFSPKAPPELQRIISKAMRKKREERYQTARELQMDLKALKRDVKSRFTGGEAVTLTRGVVDAFATRVLRRGSKQLPATLLEGAEKTHWRKLLSAGAVVLFLLAAVALYPRLRARPVLTDRDTVLIADFENKTGEPVFDGALKQATSVQLAQSPYLNILPAERVIETLRLMEKPPGEAITREIGLDICQRRNLKALLIGSITKVDTSYSLTLEAVNSRNGETIASSIVDAADRRQVLTALGQAATRLREKLGESLASIRQYDAPIEHATTASLDALKDYSAGVDFRVKGELPQAVGLFKRAVETDERFALACLQLGVTYRDLREIALGNKFIQQAYELRGRVSERERLEIASTYYRYITGELDKRLETTMLLTQTYKQDARGFHLHGNTFLLRGRYPEAIGAYRQALALDPDYSLSRANLALALIKTNRLDEAVAQVGEGQAKGIDLSSFHNRLYLTAFLRSDLEEMRRQAEWFAGKREEYQIIEDFGWASAFSGQLRTADQFFARAAARAAFYGLSAEKARILANQANLHAVLGMRDVAKAEARRVIGLIREHEIDPREMMGSSTQPSEAQSLAWTFALCDDASMAQELAAGVSANIPNDTLWNGVWRPLVEASLDLHRNDGRGALELLGQADAYAPIGFFNLPWTSGLAHLQLKQASEAVGDFQKIIDHREWNPLSPLWPLAHLGLARAAALGGDTEKARQAYQSFFTLWKSADPDLPLLIEAKKEFERLGMTAPQPQGRLEKPRNR